MEFDNVNVDLKKWRNDNFKERIRFIQLWVNKIKNMPLEKWSKGQGDFINAQFQGSKDFYSKLPAEKREKILKYMKEDLVSKG